jgi:glutaredoxin-related protein
MAKTVLFEARMCPNLNCISIMMSFLRYITGFFMNFELLSILTDYANLKKGGMKLKKNLLL